MPLFWTGYRSEPILNNSLEDAVSRTGLLGGQENEKYLPISIYTVIEVGVS